MDQMMQVRPVTTSDIDALVELDRKIFEARGTPVMSRQDLETWLTEDSPFFLLAEDGDGIQAYAFSRRINFSFSEEGIAAFLDPNLKTGKGMTAVPNHPRGNAGYGITIASLKGGGGRALTARRHEILEYERIQYFIGYSRLAGFDAYATQLEARYDGVLPCSVDDLALWYAHENARLLTMRTFALARPQPNCAFLPVTTPDTVLGFHARYTRYGILDIQSGYMPDPESRGYAAFMVSIYPHR